MKKFLAPFVLITVLAASAFAQTVGIGAPADGATVHPGKTLTVEVDRPDTLTGSTEIAIVIGFQSCTGFPAGCPPPADLMGTILFNGPYDPEFHTDVTPSKPPYQNFTVTIPASAPKGPAQLNLAHFALVGASEFPFLETRNITLKVV
ncbi:hypothetical protein GGX14DRAFT_463557 [Mycena pura]|uniref:Uncharacterized protein n=1 Tax=Mycena pura TaxID=153505 RepID=A0AAD6Y8E0_9AGAR|nr:hypothetical protein GGX14DRAFT_463557 [Mycena pura]